MQLVDTAVNIGEIVAAAGGQPGEAGVEAATRATAAGASRGEIAKAAGLAAGSATLAGGGGRLDSASAAAKASIEAGGDRQEAEDLTVLLEALWPPPGHESEAGEAPPSCRTGTGGTNPGYSFGLLLESVESAKIKAEVAVRAASHHAHTAQEECRARLGQQGGKLRVSDFATNLGADASTIERGLALESRSASSWGIGSQQAAWGEGREVLIGQEEQEAFLPRSLAPTNRPRPNRPRPVTNAELQSELASCEAELVALKGSGELDKLLLKEGMAQAERETMRWKEKHRIECGKATPQLLSCMATHSTWTVLWCIPRWCVSSFPSHPLSLSSSRLS